MCSCAAIGRGARDRTSVFVGNVGYDADVG
jgi:hypothetical protein